MAERLGKFPGDLNIVRQEYLGESNEAVHGAKNVT